MQYSIKRGLENNYFIIETRQIDDRDLLTIKENNLKSFMDSKTENINNTTKICYEISGCINMSNKFPYQTLKFCDVKTMINSIIDAIEIIDEYLLSQKSLILLPDLIFYKEDKPYFCYLPGYIQDINSSFCKLVDFMMSHIDYTDEKSVKLIYELNAKIKTEEFNIYNLRDYILMFEKNNCMDNEEAIEYENNPDIEITTAEDFKIENIADNNSGIPQDRIMSRDIKLAAERFYEDGRFLKTNTSDSEQIEEKEYVNYNKIRKIATTIIIFGSVFIALLIYLMNTRASGIKIILSALICIFLCIYIVDKQIHILNKFKSYINEYKSSGDGFENINWSEIN